MSFKENGFRYLALFMAVVAIVGGIYLTFFHSMGFVKTQATIQKIVEEVSDDSKTYRATVAYTVDGTEYSGEVNLDSSSHQTGETIEVLYDPKNPSEVHGGGFAGLYVIGVGILILAVVIGTQVRTRKALKKVKAHKEVFEAYPECAQGPERKVYFLTDTGTSKGGHRLEDADGKVLYEAKMTKFTLTAPYGFDFIDHEHGTTTPHLIGHEESSEWDALPLDSHYTFTFDGQDIWKHLKENGISVKSGLTGDLHTEFRILRNGQEIATAQSTSQNVHEESGTKKSILAGLVPVRGFYRVTTTQTDLSLLFVTLLAFARSGASDDHGGNTGVLFGS